MADLVITAANVIADANALTERGVAGETITAGQSVYFDTATRTFKRAKANDASALVRTTYGIALNSASLSQPLVVGKSGVVALGSVMTAGRIYVLSGAAFGGIAPSTDLTTGWYTGVIGIAQTTGNLLVGIVNGATVHP